MLSKNLRAFSLIELLIVLVIIGVVLAIGIPGINQARSNAELETMRTRAVSLQTAKLSFIDALGTQAASGAWNHGGSKANDQTNYASLVQYLPTSYPQYLTTNAYTAAGSPANSGALIPNPFGVALGAKLSDPVTATDAAGAALPLQKY